MADEDAQHGVVGAFVVAVAMNVLNSEEVSEVMAEVRVEILDERSISIARDGVALAIEVGGVVSEISVGFS